MRRKATALCVAVSALIAGTAYAVTDPPFTMVGRSINYVVTMRGVGPANLSRPHRIVYHRAGWTRVDESDGGSPSIMWTPPNGDTWFTFSTGRGEYLDVRTGEEVRSRLRRYAPMSRAVRRTFAGEDCTVWVVSTSTVGFGSPQESCVTADGVELARNYGDSGVGHYEATRIERRSPPVSAMRPPFERLALRGWLSRSELRAGSEQASNAEIALSSSDRWGDTSARMIMRRIGSFTHIDRTEGSYRRVEVSNYDLDFHYGLHFRDGQASLLLIQRLTGMTRAAPASLPRPGETVLGERCEWFNADGAVVVTNSPTSECRTADGLPLKIVETRHRIGTLAWTAVALRRGPLSPERLEPPAEYQRPSAWGLSPGPR